MGAERLYNYCTSIAQSRQTGRVILLTLLYGMKVLLLFMIDDISIVI
jgi:hypothetical protein